MPHAKTSFSWAFLLSVYQSTAAELTTDELIWTRWQPPIAATALSKDAVAVTLLRAKSSATRPPIWAWATTIELDAFDRVHPVAFDRQVGFDDGDRWLQFAQDEDVFGMLVDGDDLMAATLDEARYEVLSDKTGAAGDRDLHERPGSQRFERWKSARGRFADDQHDPSPEPGRVEDCGGAALARSMSNADPLGCRP